MLLCLALQIAMQMQNADADAECNAECRMQMQNALQMQIALQVRYQKNALLQSQTACARRGAGPDPKGFAPCRQRPTGNLRPVEPSLASLLGRLGVLGNA